MVVSGDEELAGLSLHLLIPLQSDDCCHCGEHWDVCNQQPHTDRQTDRQTDTVTQDLNAMAEFNPIPTSQMLMLALFPVSFQKEREGEQRIIFTQQPRTSLPHFMKGIKWGGEDRQQCPCVKISLAPRFF